MKILHLIDNLGSGGKERQLIELLKGLKIRKNVRFQLVVLSDNIHYTYVEDLNVKIHFLPRMIKKDPSIFVKLYKICKEYRPDIIHSWESMCCIYAIPIAKMLGIKFINGVIRDAPPRLKAFRNSWTRVQLTFLFSDIILANSHAGLKSYNAPRHKSYCIHNGFDFSRTNNIEDKYIVKKNFKINSAKIVGMVASFSKRKDYETYIDASLQILKKRNDVTFLAVGEGSTLKGCKEMVKQEFQERIKFLGKQKDIESIVNILDVGILVTNQNIHGEGISNSIMEYMALAKPIVATNDGGTVEIIVNNKTGFLVEHENVNVLVEKIEFLLNNDEIAKAMGIAGKKKLLEEFGLEKMTESYIELYKKCVAGNFVKTSFGCRKNLITIP